ncbi:MAG: cation:proton antiporter [Gemmatimonadota bacterium]|nr:cation:proton antiporter [Gemmatimonadota bacterium]
MSGRGDRRGLEALATRAFALLALLGLIAVWGRIETTPIPGVRVTVQLGFLLLAAFVGGQLAGRIGLSRVTGYIAVGLVLGPSALGFLSEADVSALGPFSGLAIALIALTAGGELSVRALRGSGRWLTSIAVLQTAAVLTVVFLTVLGLRDVLPFTAGRETTVVLVVAVVFASVAVASSPSVAIAVITDTKSRGPVSTAVLGVTVVKDVVVIVLFAAALAVAYGLLEPGGPGQVEIALDVAREIGGSLLVGAIAGVGIAAYLRWVGQHLVLFTLALAWLFVELAAALHLELLLLALTAGFTLENLLPVEGDRFVSALEAASLPLYAIFFGLAGAAVHLFELADVWLWALLLIGARVLGLWLGTTWGARLGGAPRPVGRLAWPAFISQAGVALGMVELVAREFPGWGEELRGIFVGMVAVHELVGPVAAKWTLDRAGEVGRAESDERESGPAAGETPSPSPASA